MKSVLLDENTVVAYLKNRGIFPLSSSLQVKALTGGVSNVVLAVSDETKSLVLKQALPQLKVKATWIVEQRRALVEARAIKALSAMTPLNVPELYDVDPERFILLIKNIPNTTNWKEDLLAGNIYPEVASALGEILGIWHRASSKNPPILQEFEEDSLFEQLRINPFYRILTTVHPDLAPRISQLIEELEGVKTSLVHGDFSPKNMLITSHLEPTVLDYETAHTGNPVFDLAFLLGHILCKQEYFHEVKNKKLLSQCAISFFAAYEIALGAKADKSLSWHVATIALARIDGLSPVSYLTAQGQQAVRTRALHILHSDTAACISEVFL